MKPAFHASCPAALVTSTLVAVLAGCPSDNSNPERLWLALDEVETRVHLVDEEPRPY